MGEHAGHCDCSFEVMETCLQLNSENKYANWRSVGTLTSQTTIYHSTCNFFQVFIQRSLSIETTSSVDVIHFFFYLEENRVVLALLIFALRDKCLAG